MHVFLGPLSLERLVRRAGIGLDCTTLLSVDNHYLGRYIMILSLFIAMAEVVILFDVNVLDTW